MRSHPYRTGQFICSKTGQLYLLTTGSLMQRSALLAPT
jgi:hypothetical protein